MKATSTFERVSQHIAEVTAEQIGKCTKVFHNNEEFYLVENESGEYDEHGIVEYPVRYDEEHGYTCECASGKIGFANVSHPSGVCKHCRWVVAAIIEERTALAAMDRVVHAQALPVVKAEVPIEVKWNIPQWMLKAPVDPKMRKAPKER